MLGNPWGTTRRSNSPDRENISTFTAKLVEMAAAAKQESADKENRETREKIDKIEKQLEQLIKIKNEKPKAPKLRVGTKTITKRSGSCTQCTALMGEMKTMAANFEQHKNKFDEALAYARHDKFNLDAVF